MKITIITFVVLCSCFSGCTKVYEEMWIERIHRPKIEIDSIAVPPWDSIPNLPNFPNIGV